jgi:predicted kinase
MTQTLYILQGVPGSGKSTLGRELVKALPNAVIYSTDDFHHDGDGEYRFKADKLPEFHRLNLERSKEALDRGLTVIVDNTNVRRWECREYVKYAHSKGIPVVFVRVTGNFKTLHGVPEDRIQAMREAMENLTLETVLESKAPWEVRQAVNLLRCQ